MSHYELTIEVRQVDEAEALALARGVSKQFAASVTVVEVVPGRTTPRLRRLVQTVEPDDVIE